MDPFGWGPSSSTFSRILRSGEPYLAKYFRLLLEKSEVREAKKRGLKIVVGVQEFGSLSTIKNF